jgi:hypothetical protein
MWKMEQAEDGWFRLICRHTGNPDDPHKARLNAEGGTLSVSSAAPDVWHSAMWKKEHVDGTWFRLRCRHTGKSEDDGRALKLNAEHGKLSVYGTQASWHSAMWKMDPIDDTWFRLICRHTGNARDPRARLTLNAERGKLSIYDTPHSAMWKMEWVPPPAAPVGVLEEKSNHPAGEVHARAAGAAENKKRRLDPPCSDQPPAVCSVCLDQPSTHAFIPCGHLSVCQQDGDLIMTGRRQFPICNATASGLMKIWAV